MSWNDKISKAEKFQAKARTHGRKVYRRYEDDRPENEYLIKKANLFYSNVNTLKESLFNSLPKPSVARMQKGSFEDDASRVAALIVQRGLTYEVECAPHFEEAIKAAILDRLVPGIGQVWVTFEMQNGPGAEDEEGEETEGDPIPGTEQIGVENVFWEDFLYEPARRWSKVGWVGRIVRFTESEFKKRFGEEKFAQVSVDKPEKDADDSEATKEINCEKICVYEIWDKKTKKQIFTCKGMEKPLEENDDPYGLKDFFPCPAPLLANATTNKFLPVTDYHIAQDQYQVLDTLYARINLIIKAIKVAGVYDAGAEGLQRMFESSENTLIPIDNWAMYAETGGIKGHMDFYPVEVVASVLQMLQAQWEAAKATLYEITGMSDIIRGASNQYETASAQQIKAQFASVRLNGYQRDVATFVRGTLRIISELMCQLYSVEKLQLIVGPLAEPDMAYAEEALGILRDDFISQYKVDIQANSLTQSDWALEKEQRMEVVTALGQMIGQVVQASEAAPEIMTLGVQMIKFAIAGFKGASELEGYIDQQLDSMLQQQQEAKKNPQPPQPSPEEVKMQGEMQKMQMEAQLKQTEAEANLAMEQQKMQMDMQMKEMEFAHKERMYALEIQMKQMELALKEKAATLDLEVKQANAALDLETKQSATAMDLEQKEVSNEQQTRFAEEKAQKAAKEPPRKGKDK
jgi:hypothetical protein